ncbi:MAG TPA: transcription termination factor NusA [Candidatus Pacearchaeota archaeon]|jgi:N utilization substance protein A|nr:transcription termination factor NusA [Candidatus Pacearchaeota archaeon]
MDLKNFTSAITQLAEEKDIPKKKVLEIVEVAIASAYKKEYGEKGQIIKATMDAKTGELSFCQSKLVVDESMILTEEEIEELKQGKGNKKEEDIKKVKFNPERHLLIEDAKKIKADVMLGEEIEIPLPTQTSFGRIAAQTAKQVILQKIKEVERESVLDEYKNKQGEIVSGSVQRVEGFNVFVDLGKTLGTLPKDEQNPRESYRIGQRIKCYVLRVDETSKGPVIVLSRTNPNLIVKLFELEAPEVSSGSVQIKAISREPGSRSKIAVYSKAEEIDPIGSVVGQKGTRVTAVISEVNGEKIDVIEYSEDPSKFIANALSPAKVLEVDLTDDDRAVVTVPEDQLSLAIGKDGQNVRLAAKLTGWKIDVKGLSSDNTIVDPEEEIK